MDTTTRWTLGVTRTVLYLTRAVAALTVLFLAHDAARADVIVDQSSGETGQFIPSQEFPDLPAYTAVAFDNFTIGTPLHITTLTAFGVTTGNPSSNLAVVAGIYASPDLTTSPVLSASGTQVGADLFFDFGGATLAAGSYWLGAYIVRNNSAGAWLWNLRLPISGSQALWHNPGGGRGAGASPSHRRAHQRRSRTTATDSVTSSTVT